MYIPIKEKLPCQSSYTFICTDLQQCKWMNNSKYDILVHIIQMVLVRRLWCMY